MTNVVALATYSAERKFKLCPTAQIQRIRRWCKPQGMRVVRGFYNTASVNPTTKRDGLASAIDEVRKHEGAVIVTLDCEGVPTALKVLGGGGV